LQSGVCQNTGTGSFDLRTGRRFALGLPLADKPQACLAPSQAKEKAAGEPHRVRAEAPKWRGADRRRKLTTSIQPAAERRRQLMEKVASQMGHRVAKHLRPAVRLLQEVGAMVGRALLDDSWTIRTVLGCKRNGGVGEVIQLGERCVEIGSLTFGC